MTYESAVLALSPRLFWKLNEASGASYADSGALGVAGTASGSVVDNQGALYVGGSSVALLNDYIYASGLQAEIRGWTAFTVVAWIKPSTSADPWGVTAEYPGTGVLPFYLASHGLNAGVSDPTHYHFGDNDHTLASTSLVSTQAAFLAGSRDASKVIRLYVNGVLENTSAAGTAALSGWNGTKVYIGRRWDSSTSLAPVLNDATTRIAGVALFDYQLSDAQIASLAAYGAPPVSAPSVTVFPGNGCLTLAWPALDDAGSYDVSDGTTTVNTTSTSYTWTGLTNGTPQTLTVAGRNASGAGPSASITVAPSASAGYPNQVARDNPLSYWRLDDTSGTTMAAVIGYPGTYTGSPTLGAASLLASDPTDAAVGFALNKRADVPYAAWMNTSYFSYEALVNMTSLVNGNNTIITRDNQINQRSSTFTLDTAGHVAGVVWISGSQKVCTGATVLVPGTTYHVAMTYDGANIKVYVNGVLDGTLAAVGVQQSSVCPARIAADLYYATQWYFNGTIDELAHYGYALTAAQIATHYSLVAAPPSGTLSDSVTFSDVVTRTVAVARGSSDAVTAGESLTRAVSLARAAADATTAGDTATATGASAVAASDLVTASDTVARTVGASRSVSDATVAGDSVSRTVALARPIAESATFGEVVASLASFSATLSDAVTLADAAQRVVGASRATSDTFTTTDALASVVAFARSVTDGVTLIHEPIRIVNQWRALAPDSVTLTDVVTRYIGPIPVVAVPQVTLRGGPRGVTLRGGPRDVTLRA